MAIFHLAHRHFIKCRTFPGRGMCRTLLPFAADRLRLPQDIRAALMCVRRWQILAGQDPKSQHTPSADRRLITRQGRAKGILAFTGSDSENGQHSQTQRNFPHLDKSMNDSRCSTFNFSVFFFVQTVCHAAYLPGHKSWPDIFCQRQCGKIFWHATLSQNRARSVLEKQQIENIESIGFRGGLKGLDT